MPGPASIMVRALIFGMVRPRFDSWRHKIVNYHLHMSFMKKKPKENVRTAPFSEEKDDSKTVA